MKRASLQKGFTLVEIMIVIAVIAILAAIAIISYTGYQERARETKAKADMEAIGEATENYLTLNPGKSIDNAAYAAILKNAGLYDQTRVEANSSFAFCYDAASRSYAIAAWNPVVTGYKNKDKLITYSNTEQQQVTELKNSSLESANKLSKLCGMMGLSTTTYSSWSSAKLL